METRTYQVWPVYSVHGDNEAYLQLTRQGERIKVMPTTLGRQKLNGRLWPLWLQGLILNKTKPELAYAVELSGLYLLVSSGQDIGSMRHTLEGLAAQVFPLRSVLTLKTTEESGLAVWAFNPGHREINDIPMELLIATLQLPRGASVQHTPSFNMKTWEVRLQREQSCRTPMRELLRLVELHFCQACT